MGKPDNGPAENERLTAITAIVLVLLLALEGITILAIRPLLSLHVFVGILLIPPVALKLASTGYRFLRYYGASVDYVRRGPPHVFLRLLAPFVVVSTLAVFATGVSLLALGPGHDTLVGLHKASFVAWFGATGAHVLAHLRRVPRLAFSRTPGAARRIGLVSATVLAGAVLAASTVSLASPWSHRLDADDPAGSYLSVLI